MIKKSHRKCRVTLPSGKTISKRIQSFKNQFSSIPQKITEFKEIFILSIHLLTLPPYAKWLPYSKIGSKVRDKFFFYIYRKEKHCQNHVESFAERNSEKGVLKNPWKIKNTYIIYLSLVQLDLKMVF